MNRAEPFLRWAGGKQWLLNELISVFPQRFGTFYEPFLGGGAVFLSLSPSRSILSDSNAHLIDAYIQIRDHPQDVIKWLKKWRNEINTYYQVRKSTYESRPKMAARLIYLNKTCWNGLYRVNRKGEFNVPYGNSPNRSTYNLESIQEASIRLKKARLICGDFERCLAYAQAKDLIYLDPPYTTMHSNNGFLRYNETLFSWYDQQRLSKIANMLAERGCFVVASNANHPSLRNLYQRNFKSIVVQRKSNLSGNPDYRKIVTEVVFISNNIQVDELCNKEMICQ